MGHFKFQTKFCPELKRPEIFCVQNLKGFGILKTLSIKNIFKDLFYRSLMEVFLPLPYPPLVTLIEDQLRVILLEILSEVVRWNSIFVHWLLSM